MLKNIFRRFWNFVFQTVIRGKISKFRKTQIFERNSALNCFTVNISYIRGLHLNTKKTILAILEFSILKEEIAKLKNKKKMTFEFNSAPNYFIVRKFHEKELD